jgi:Zn-dependent M28 family amino/carboxypeptidase
MRKVVGLSVVALGLVAGSSLPAFAQRSKSNAELITAAQLRDYLTFVASDEMEGRNTPSRGLDTTALFISTLLKRWGAKPAGDDGTFFQKIVLRRDSPDVAQTKLQLGEQAFAYGEDYVSGGGEAALTAPLVYVGDGWMVKSKDIDAYKGIDAKGKIVVVNYSNGFSPPRGLRRNDLTGAAGTDWANPRTYARMKGAVGIVFVFPPSMQADWDRLRLRDPQGRWSPEKFRVPGEPDLPAFTVSPKVTAALFQGEKSNTDAIDKAMADSTSLAAFDLSAGKKATLTAVTKIERTNTQNVTAIFEGSDPALKNEYVAVGAHYDHIGMATRPVNGDTIYNGADDDGSGTTALIAMAEALGHAKKRPKRSTLFVWHCGEEKGLWGSRYFNMLPTVPTKQIITQLNIDMIGRSRVSSDTKAADRQLSGPDEVYVIGSKMMSSELGALSEQVNKGYLKLNFNYKYDDPKDPNRFFFRSDHFNYAQKGIPIIFYFDGVHEDYHGLGDEVQKIDFNKMERIARTVYETLWAVSDLKTRPVIDKKLPPELTQ